MKFYRINMEGKQWLQRDPRGVFTPGAAPTGDVGRLIYDSNDNTPYIGTNAAWAKLWTDLNDGPGSGLNADQLDNYHAGNSSGQIPINNGVMNTNLIAQYLGASGQDAAFFRNAGNSGYP